MSSLKDVSILITSFLRPGYLAECLKDISYNLDQCQSVVADDSDDLPPMLGLYDEWATLPYDSGLTAKRNAAVKLVKTKYTLLGCDDFDFSTKEVRDGILKLVAALDAYPEVAVAVGRYGNAPYEGTLEYVPGSFIREYRLPDNPKPYGNGPLCHQIDIGVNYFLARTEVLKNVPWDQTIAPIGGEHVDFFLDLKEANKVVVWVPGVNINQQTPNLSKQDARYAGMRGRCWDGHTLMKKKRNIKSYVDFGGHLS